MTNRRRSATCPAFFREARGVTAIARRRIAVVARLVSCDKPITTFGGAHDAIAVKPIVTRARERSWRIRTCRLLVAIVRGFFAFINVRAQNPIAFVTHIARTRERSRCICARRMSIAIIGVQQAFVNVRTRNAVAFITNVAFTGERAWRIDTSRVIATIVRFEVTFVDIRTLHCRRQTFESDFNDACSRTTIARRRITIVTRFARFEQPVAAHRNGSASHHPARRIPASSNRTRIVRTGIAVIAIHIGHAHRRTNGHTGHGQIELTRSSRHIASDSNSLRAESKR